MNTIMLYGNLSEKFGERFVMDVRDPAEAFRALDCQLAGFREMVRTQNFTLVRQMPNGDFILDEQMLFIGMNNTTLHFFPTIEGDAKGKGVAKTVLGVGLIVGSFFIPGSTMLLGMALKGMAFTLGLSLALGGAALLLSPTPKLETGEGKDDNSFLFSGDTNSAGQNFPVPVTYGIDRVRPIPIATQIKTNEYTIPQGTTMNFPPSGIGGAITDGIMYRSHVRNA